MRPGCGEGVGGMGGRHRGGSGPSQALRGLWQNGGCLGVPRAMTRRSPLGQAAFFHLSPYSRLNLKPKRSCELSTPGRSLVRVTIYASASLPQPGKQNPSPSGDLKEECAGLTLSCLLCFTAKMNSSREGDHSWVMVGGEIYLFTWVRDPYQNQW